ncbi:MAG: FAD-dependent oxidoreductase [Candidatus Acidiferrales bacterium]
MAENFDVVVVGAGVFGSWTAHFLQRAGRRVLLLDAYGPGNSRASSGGESRIIRMGYGPDELYTRWSMHSLPLWEDLNSRTGAQLFHRTGMLWIARESDEYARATLATLERLGARFEKMNESTLRQRFPQFAFENGMFGFIEPASGSLMARRAVSAVVNEAVQHGATYRTESVETPSGRGRLESIRSNKGVRYAADSYVFACGAWLPQIFPDALGDRIFPTRQEVFFFGAPPGDARFAAPAMPTFIDGTAEFYGMPNLESRGIKLGYDQHGPRVSPDKQERVPSAEALMVARNYLARRFPALRDAPLVESRVCQYENTSNGDFLIDRHPDFENVWIAGGGSGHGFKHGPAVGEYVTERLTTGGPVEPRFSLATKMTVQKRAIF